MIVKYICSYCDKEFDTQEACEEHEKLHDVSLWTNKDYAKWFRKAAEEVKKQKKVVFGYNNQYLTSALSYKVNDVEKIFKNVAEILAPSTTKKDGDNSTKTSDESTTSTEPTDNPSIGDDSTVDEPSTDDGKTENPSSETSTDDSTTTEPPTEEGLDSETEGNVAYD